MDARAQSRRRIEIDLRAAIAERRAAAVIISRWSIFRPASITGFEALVRWPHPERGIISPAEFIPVAEETGLIDAARRLDAAPRLHGRRALARRRQASRSTCRRCSFAPATCCRSVMDALKQSGLPAKRLELEITETLLLEKSESCAGDAARAARARRAHFDGRFRHRLFQSLSYLRRFPFDKIKIDRSFVHDLGANRDAQAIVRAILSLGTGLGITITAEGVETEAELGCLNAEGCHEGQGFLFSKARPNAEIVGLLQAQCGADFIAPADAAEEAALVA